MGLSRSEMQRHFDQWFIAWNNHDIDGVMEFLHDEIVFENWDEKKISGKPNLAKSWGFWFMRHGNFKFFLEDLFIDEMNQKMAFSWKLEWPSLEIKYPGKQERRRGIDILYLRDGKIFRKNTYSKTAIEIDSRLVALNAE